MDHFQSETIPDAPKIATAGVALNMKRAAFQDMKQAVKIQILNTIDVCFLVLSPSHANKTPVVRDNTNNIGPKEANSCPRGGAFASATVSKILVLAKYPEPVNSTSQALEISKNFRTNNSAKKIIPATIKVPSTSSQGLSLNPIVTYEIARVNPRINKNG